MTPSSPVYHFVISYDIRVTNPGDNSRFKEALLSSPAVFDAVQGQNLSATPRMIRNTMPTTTLFIRTTISSDPSAVRTAILQLARTNNIVVTKLFTLCATTAVFDLWNLEPLAPVLQAPKLPAPRPTLRPTWTPPVIGTAPRRSWMHHKTT
jgi:hypothetical protein